VPAIIRSVTLKLISF
jgi:uncharacterized membrane protein